MSKKVIILIIILVSLVGVLYLFTREQGKWLWITTAILGETFFPTGEASKEDVVTTYLKGLTQQNATKISRIVHPNFKANEEIKAKINELGGNEFKDITVTYKKPYPEFLPAKVNAHITGKMITPEGEEFPFDEVLKIDGFIDRFCLVMGEVRNPVSPENAIIMEERPE